MGDSGAFWEVSLLRREMRCARPPFWRGLWLFRADSGRDLGFWAGFGLGCPSDSRRRQEGFAMHFSDRAPDLRSGLIIVDSGAVQASCPNRALNLRIGCGFSIANESPPQWLGQALVSR